MKTAMVLAMLLAGCGGRIATDPPGPCSNETLCAEFAAEGPKVHGETFCEGHEAFFCCGYTTAELEHLADTGDLSAPHCLEAGSGE